MWYINLKIAIRNLLSNRVSSSINLLGLTIGMASALTIFIWVQNELTFDRHHQNAHAIYRVLSHWKGSNLITNYSKQPLSLSETAKNEIPEIDDFFILRPASQNPVLAIAGKGVFSEKEMAYVSSNWFEGFDYKIIEGSFASFQDGKSNIALTQSQAIKYFGDQPALGQEIRMEANSYRVSLILQDNPSNSSFQFKAFLPLQALWPNQAAYEQDLRVANHNYMTFFSCGEGHDPNQVTKKLDVILQRLTEGEKSNRYTSVEPLLAMRFNEEIPVNATSRQSKSTVYIYGLIGLLLLLTAGLNYINLTTATISGKIKEIGLKKVVGARFHHIFYQVILETSLLSLVAFTLAICIVQSGLPLLSGFIGSHLVLDFSNPYILIILTGIISLNILIAGVYPAALFAGVRPIKLIKRTKASRKNESLRKVLVTTQFVITIATLIGAGVIYQQLQYIQGKEVGYERDHVLEISPNLHTGDVRRNFDQFSLFAKALNNITGIQGVSLGDAPLVQIENQNRGSFNWTGKPENLNVVVSQLAADQNLLSVFDLQIKDGRWFQSEIETDQNNIIVNEAAVKEFNLPEPVVGQAVSFRGREGTIIGVMEDFHYGSLHKEIDPLVIRNSRGRGSFVLAKIHGDNVQRVLTEAELKFNDLLPGIPFQYQFADNSFTEMHQADIKTGVLFRSFAGLLIFISCLGLLGLSMFSAEQRTKEIGIRKVLGASVVSIVRLLTAEFPRLVLLAIFLAAPLAWLLIRTWLNNFAYQTSMLWLPFVLAGTITLLIVFLTVSIYGIRVALINPADSLRND